MPRNPTWTRDELLVVLDLYLDERRVLEEYDPRVIETSKLLNDLPIHEEAGRPGFRTPDAVVLRLANFRSYDPQSPARGMRNAGRAAEEVWHRFAGDAELVARIAQSIRRASETLPRESIVLEEAPEEEFPEGRLVYRLHRQRERQPAMRRRKIGEAEGRGEIPRCEVCGLAPEALFGARGRSVLECHHRRPLEAGERHTRLTDLALVCANCHGALHSKGALITPEVLREQLPASFRDFARGMAVPAEDLRKAAAVT